jgi:opacity protein-like surface antigen
MRTIVSSDFEGAPDMTVAERLTQYTFQAGLVQHYPDLQFARVVPFATAGVGIQRVAHEDDTLVETGVTFYFGGGVTVPMVSASGALKMVGVRVDGRAVGRREGAAFDDKVRFVGAVGASLVIRF